MEDAFELAVVIPLEDPRGDIADHLRTWTHRQDLDRDRYQVVVAGDGEHPEFERGVEELLSPQDVMVRIPGALTMGLYAAAKGALLSLTRVAAIEWAGQGVRVNAVAPGLTATPLVHTWINDQDDPVAFEKGVVAAIPQGRMAQPIDVANAILFLASDESRHVTGITLAVDGGYTAA